ncbi:helix-turn-helix domain-containing protein [Arachidicoccus terrestris]|uniref:helix-turn-helix domain-containing protein n=1 Tax=Arachidicoccus terrestris TaxID=2875539 RepID=UPI001CC7624A|nr:helix-turn-helix transcriptional regulator [Arachidicoccus terrestris]UAY56824.1 helix-turn-helix domain-containing protein [Arachidicoccus terrestris]
MQIIYNFDTDSPEELLLILAGNLKKRRLEKGLSRNALSMTSGVSASTISKFEIHHMISLESFVKLAKALGYTKMIRNLLSEPIYQTMEELELINKNKNRKNGRITPNK